MAGLLDVKRIVPYIFFLVIGNILAIISFSFISVMSAIDWYYRFTGKVNPLNVAILVTGADSSLGLAVTRKLASMGYTVFAAVKVLDEETEKCLKQSGPNVLPLECDVIKYRDVSETVKYVNRNLGLKRLWSVVCADSFYSSNSPLLFSNSIQAYSDSLKVTALGCARLTKAFLPLLQKCPESRIIFVIGMPGGLELPGNISYTIARASESQFIHIIRNELSKYRVWASVFDCTRGIERRSLASLRTQSLLASPVPSEASSPEITFTKCQHSTRSSNCSSNWHPLSSPEKRKESDGDTPLVVTDGATRKAEKVCRAIVCRDGPPVFI